jgi:hypothetical protein
MAEKAKSQMIFDTGIHYLKSAFNIAKEVSFEYAKYNTRTKGFNKLPRLK